MNLTKLGTEIKTESSLKYVGERLIAEKNY